MTVEDNTPKRMSNYSASKCKSQDCNPNDATAKTLILGKLGGSGIHSSRRSTITKNMNSKNQAGFDKFGDKTKGIGQIVKLSSARPSNLASLISSVLGPDDAEKPLKKFLCVPITNNVKALFTMMVLFSGISFGQYFAAEAANSQSLKADVVSMAADAVSYFGNIMGESSDVADKRIVLQLFFSMMSLVMLNYFNTVVFIESIQILQTSEKERESDSGDGEGVVASLVFTFALLGLLIDAVCLLCYRYFAKKDADVEYQAMLELAKKEGKDLDQAGSKIEKPEINMLTALLHVSADLMRSTSTFVEGIILFAGGLTPAGQEYVDAICGIFIGITIYCGSIYAIWEWCMSFWQWFSGLGKVIEVLCPECNTMIEIKPDKAESGKVADTVLG